MCDSSSIMEKFEVLKEFEISDYHSKAIHLRHKKTGLEVFHMLNDDEENLFAFAFRTPNPKANGAAHILEHSVLCGSERFPLKDPFVNLSNQSLKTYLNAMTYPDKTVYPASSIVRADYFNLMNVYGDAVFFPRLNKEIFMQEAHRIELDENSKPSIQGVVYNEMKGSYSDFDSVASDAKTISLMPNSIYEKDSGGDPLVIPEITHEELVAFHEKWYRPDNCLVFLYGNIPTCDQLQFLQEKFIDRLEKKFPDIEVSENARNVRLQEFLKFVTPSKIEKPYTYRCKGPSGDGENGETVLVSWNLGHTADADRITENIVLTGILLNHDGLPLQKNLVESGLGEDIAPQTGLSNSIYNSLFTIGLRCVKEGNAEKVEKLVLDTLNKIVEDGLRKKDIDAILQTLEFTNREIKRSHGPYSLVLMTRPINGWLYGDGVENQIRQRKNLDVIKEKIRTEPKYLENLIKERLIENQSRSLIIVSPSSEYTEERKQKEKEILDSSMKKTSVEKIKADCEALHKFQSSVEDTSCLPHLNPKDFITDGHPFMNIVNGEISEIEGVPFFVNRENTNGILYFDLGLPIDVLSPKDFPLLPFFSDSVTDCGWKGKDWAEVSEDVALHMGAFSVSLLNIDGPDTESARKMQKKYAWCKRPWIVFRISMMEEEILESLKILFSFFESADFMDYDRLSDLLKESKNDFESSIIPDGHTFVAARVLSKLSKSAAIDEIWSGISQYFTLKALSEKKVEDISADFRRIFTALKSGGAFVHVCGEDSGISKLREVLPQFIKSAGLKYPERVPLPSDSEFFALTEIKGEGDENPLEEVFTSSSQVGYGSECIPASCYGTKEASIEEVCAHWLSNGLLWEKIRTIGGAYGAFCDTESFAASLTFTTYRDPTPFASCKVFESCIKEALDFDFDQEEVEKAVMGCYSHYIQPQTPRARGAVYLTRLLFGVSDEDRERKILWLLGVTSEDMKNTFRRLFFNIENPARRRVILCGKTVNETADSTRKIIPMPL